MLGAAILSTKLCLDASANVWLRWRDRALVKRRTLALTSFFLGSVINLFMVGVLGVTIIYCLQRCFFDLKEVELLTVVLGITAGLASLFVSRKKVLQPSGFDKAVNDHVKSGS